MLNLYGNPLSPHVTKVHYFLEETATPYAYHSLNVRDEKARVSLAQVSAFTKIPAIELNGFHLGEANAILRYLAARGEHWHLYPVNLEDRARVDQVYEFTQIHIAQPLLRLFWNLHWAPKLHLPVDDKSVDDARSVLPGMLERLNQHIAGRSYLAGAELTLADIALAPYFAQTKQAQLSLADFPHVQAWSDRLLQRPAWKKVSADLERRLAEMLAPR